MMLTALPLSNVIYFYYLYVSKCPWLFATKKIKCEVKSNINWLRFLQTTHIKILIMSVTRQTYFFKFIGVIMVGDGEREKEESPETWSRHVASTFPLKPFVHFENERKKAEKLIRDFARLLLLGGQKQVHCMSRKKILGKCPGLLVNNLKDYT